MTIHAKTISGWGMRAVQHLVVDGEGAQLLEFALVLPFILVMAIGIVDFSRAYTVKQKLNNAARDGARVAAGESSAFIDLSAGKGGNCSGGKCVQTITDVIANYLTSANVGPCVVGTASTSGAFETWTVSSSTTGCGTFQIKIERFFTFTNASGTAIATRITINYPFQWKVTGLMRLMVPGTTFAGPTTISSNAVMPNLF
jgi:hypothetical protein